LLRATSAGGPSKLCTDPKTGRRHRIDEQAGGSDAHTNSSDAVATAAMFGSVKAEQAADDHLGTVHFPISCNGVQAKFDRGVTLLHNFFYPETVKAFQAVIQEDPSCAIAYWGLAMSELPNPLVPPLPLRQPQSRVGGNPTG